MRKERRQRWQELTQLLDRTDRRGLESISVAELKQLCCLYRQVTIDLSQARTDAKDPDLVRYLNILAGRAHGRVYGARRVDLRGALTFITHGFPRLIRKHARPILIATAAFALTTLASFLAVVRSPELAYSLFDEHIVEYENIRLQRQHGEYRGNFTFDVSSSPLVAAQIIGNNLRVTCMGFSFGALGCLPGLMLLVYNGRMLGTLSGMVWNHGFFFDFYALILTHGVLELTAICIGSGGGLTIGWAMIAPGRLARREAMKRAAVDALGLLGGAAFLLLMAGLIEAYITPHFSQPVRCSVALLSALWLAAYFGLAGRTPAGRQLDSKQAAKADLKVSVDQGRRDGRRNGVEDVGTHLAEAL